MDLRKYLLSTCSTYYKKLVRTGSQYSSPDAKVTNMTPLRTVCLLALLVATASASPNKHKIKDWLPNLENLKPSNWLPVAKLLATPSIQEVTWQQLENMSVDEGEELIKKLYHLAQINHSIPPSFVPSPSIVPVNIFKNNGQATSTNLNQLVQTARAQPNFGDQEVTIIITGLPQSSPAAAKATKKLVQAYMQRYNGQQQVANGNNNDYDYGNEQGQGNQERTSSEEDYSESWKGAKNSKGNLIVINLGATITSFKRFAMLDVEKTGQMIGNALVQLTEEAGVNPEIVHIVALGIGAQVAGPAGRAYTRQTGQRIRRITALDPSKMFAKNPNELGGLSRGDADLVDAIHTSTCGLGTSQRTGDIDFYPSGPASTAPGAKDVIEAAMRAARYFAESVRPGNERNFPAVAANSVQQYKSSNGNGKRAYMGIETDFDMEGDYILQVNPQSPFGQKAPAPKHNHHQNADSQYAQLRNANQNDY